MKKIIFFIVVMFLASCTSNRTAYLIRTNAVNSAEACDLLQSNQRYQYKLALKNSRKKSNKRSTPGNQLAINKKENTGKVMIVTDTVSGNIVRLKETDQTIALIENEEDTRVVGNPGKPTIQNQEVAAREILKPKRVPQFLQLALKPFRESASVLFLIGLSGLAALGLMKAGERKSKEMSRWAKEHPTVARTSIAGVQILTGLGGLALGHDLYNTGVMLPEYSAWLPAGMLTAAAAFYPNNYISGMPAFSYLQRKMHDIALFTGCAMMATYAGNHYSISKQELDPRPSVITISGTYHLSLKKNDFLSYNSSKETSDKRKGMTKTEKVLATIGVSILFNFLAMGVAAFACSLSCQGYVGASYLVGFGGGGLLVWGLVALYRIIFTAPAKQKPKAEATQASSY